MQLTLYSDYSLRVLIYLSQCPKEVSTINEISEFYRISRNHLVKVVHRLAQLNFIKSVKGKGGGIKLAKDPSHINVGDVVRKTEASFQLVECFNEVTNQCVITGHCRLKGILQEGMFEFFKVLDKYTLTDCSNPSLQRLITNE